MVLKVILILFIVYFLVFRFFGMLIRPFLSFLFTDQNRKYNSGDFFQNDRSNTPEGELRIEHVPQKKKKRNKNFDGGEYVDYEEVK